MNLAGQCCFFSAEIDVRVPTLKLNGRNLYISLSERLTGLHRIYSKLPEPYHYYLSCTRYSLSPLYILPNQTKHPLKQPCFLPSTVKLLVRDRTYTPYFTYLHPLHIGRIHDVATSTSEMQAIPNR